MLKKKRKIPIGRKMLVKVDKDTKKSDCRTMGFEKRPKIVITKWKCLSSWETLVTSRWIEKSVTNRYMTFSKRNCLGMEKKKMDFCHKMLGFIGKRKKNWKLKFYLSKSQTDRDTATQCLWNNNKIGFMSPNISNLVTAKRPQDLTIPLWEFFVQTVKKGKTQNVAFSGMHKAT